MTDFVIIDRGSPISTNPISRSACFGIVVSLVALILSAMPVAAQVDPVFDAKGYQQNRSYFSDEPFETIDTFTGNLVLTFTDLAFPGNAGSSLRFVRSYNSKGLYPSPWTFGIAGVPIRIVDPGLPPVGIDPPESAARPKLITADGGEQTTTWLDALNGFDLSTFRWVITKQFWKYDRTTRTLYLPDGSVCHFDANLRLTDTTDAFGNLVALTWSTGSLVVTQVLGNRQSRVVSFEMDDASYLPTQMTYEGRVWTYSYDPSANGPLLRHAASPVGLSWAYGYDPTTSELTSVDTPFGGHTQYTYGTFSFQRPSTRARGNGGPVTVNSRVVTQRDTSGRGVAAGTWTYTYSRSFYDTYNAVVAPSGTRTTYHHAVLGFDGSRDVNPDLDSAFVLMDRLVEVLQGTSYLPIEQEHRDYRILPVAQAYYNIDGTPELKLQTISRDGRNYTTTHTYSDALFGDFHRPQSTVETGEIARTTSRTFDYGFTGYIVGKPASETVTVSGESFTKSWTYDHNTGFRTSERDYGILATFAPDAFGNVATVTKGNGKATTSTYSWGIVSAIQTPEYTTTRIINPEGTVASETSAGRTTTFTYDDLFRIRITAPPLSNSITTTYNNSDGSTVTVSRGSSSITTTLDGFGRPIAMVNSVGIQARTQYDAEGRKTYEGYPFTSTDLGTAITYDGLGRVTRRTNPDSTYQGFTYWSGTVTIRDENGKVTVQTYLAFGHPDDVRLTQVLDANQNTWGYSYNALGKLTRVTAPDGIVRSWIYDSRNLLASETHPESGTVTYNSYDDAGNLLRKTDARGTGFVYGYDGNDRLKTILSGAQVTSMTYEPGSDRRQTAVVGTTSSTFTYDGAGRLAKRDDVIDGLAFVRVFDYDGNDNVTGITYASGRHITIGFDSENRISQILDQTFNRNLASSFAYHPSGNETAFTSGNGILNQMTFDAQRYWPKSTTAGPLGLTYDTYDGVGNVTAIIDSRGPSFLQGFAYDSLYRMTSAQGPYGSLSFAYDAHGNRATAGGTTYTYEPGKLRLINQQGMPYSYDNNGNLITGPNATYTYTSDNMLESATITGGTSTYVYDADNWRIKAVTSSGTSYFLRGPHGELLTELRNPGTSSTVTKDYVYAGTRLVAVISLP